LTTLFAANAQAGSRRKTSSMGTAEDFTGGKITRRVSRATKSMFQSVALMIFNLIPTLPFRGGEGHSAMETRERVVALCQFQSSSAGQVWNSGTSQTGQISCKAKVGEKSLCSGGLPGRRDRNPLTGVTEIL